MIHPHHLKLDMEIGNEFRNTYYEGWPKIMDVPRDDNK